MSEKNLKHLCRFSISPINKINFTMQTDLKTMKDLMQEKWDKRPLIISGPCSAETEEQVLETATRLAKTGKVDVLQGRHMEAQDETRHVRRHRR